MLLDVRAGGRAADLLVAFLGRSGVSPVVDRVLPLDRVREGHRALQAQEHVGKVVLQLDTGGASA